MNVVAINSSPHGQNGTTHAILQPFLQGMRDAGATIHTYFTNTLTIRPCQGDYQCMFRHPGQCVLRDDMQSLYPSLAEADIWVFASPLYAYGLSAPLKTFVDRLGPLALPFFAWFNGQIGHPWRDTTHVSKMVLVSSCGFPDLDGFDPLVQQLMTYCDHVGRNGMATEFAGALLRPSGSYLLPMKESGAPVDDIFQAAREAGGQIIREGRMSSETLRTISRALIPQSQEALVEEANHYVQRILAMRDDSPSDVLSAQHG